MLGAKVIVPWFVLEVTATVQKSSKEDEGFWYYSFKTQNALTFLSLHSYSYIICSVLSVFCR